MTLLDRYLARRIIAVFLKISLSLVLLYVLVDLLTHRKDNIASFDIPLHMVALYYLTFVPTILFKYQAGALAVLVSGLMVLGKAAQDNEITASLAGGISFWRLSVAPLVVAGLVSVVAFAVQDTMGARAASLSVEIERQYFSSFTTYDHRGVSWTNLGDGWTCHVLRFNRAALTGEDVILHLIQPEKEVDILADRIYWDDQQDMWILEDGVEYIYFPQREMERIFNHFAQRPAPFQERPEQLFSLEKEADSKSAEQLRQDLEGAESLGLRTTRHWVDYYSKFAQPGLCFIMMLLALPFAVRVRRGGLAIGFGISVIIGASYVLLYYAGIGLGYLEMLPPLVAAWLANVVFLIVGALLYLRTPT